MKQCRFRVVLLVVMMALASLAAHAQERGFAFTMMGNSGILKNNFMPVNLDVTMGYNFNSVFNLSLRSEANYALFDEPELNRHYVNNTVGLMAKANVYKFSRGILDLRAGGGVTLYKRDWQYSYWDAGIYFQATRDLTKPTVGLGVRYYDGFGAIESNYWQLYLSFGFTYN